MRRGLELDAYGRWLQALQSIHTKGFPRDRRAVGKRLVRFLGMLCKSGTWKI